MANCNSILSFDSVYGVAIIPALLLTANIQNPHLENFMLDANCTLDRKMDMADVGEQPPLLSYVVDYVAQYFKCRFCLLNSFKRL